MGNSEILPVAVLVGLVALSLGLFLFTSHTNIAGGIAGLAFVTLLIDW